MTLVPISTCRGARSKMYHTGAISPPAESSKTFHHRALPHQESLFDVNELTVPISRQVSPFATAIIISQTNSVAGEIDDLGFSSAVKPFKPNRHRKLRNKNIIKILDSSKETLDNILRSSCEHPKGSPIGVVDCIKRWQNRQQFCVSSQSSFGLGWLIYKISNWL